MSNSATLTRIVVLGNTGFVVALHGGRIVEIGGRSHWEDAAACQRSAERSGVAFSPMVIDTTSPH